VRERDGLDVDDGGQSVRESRLSARTSVRVSTVPPSSDEFWSGLIGVPELELGVERTGERHHLGSDVEADDVSAARGTGGRDKPGRATQATT
jgi:hypothetical protein